MKITSTLDEKVPVEELLYRNLCRWFNWTLKECLGDHYYNLGDDVYMTHQLACKDLVQEFKDNEYLIMLLKRTCLISIGLNAILAIVLICGFPL